MDNKGLITKLRDNAELPWAAYGYFHLANESYKPEENSKDWKRLKYFRDIKEDTTQSVFPTLIDILNIEYKYFKDEKTGKLKMASLMMSYLVATSPHSKLNNSFLAMIC
ncbi:hypothetical protein ACV7FS_001826 [Campylobacter jejuni]